MAKPLLDDALWSEIEPFLPPPKKRRTRFPGRKPVEHRTVLTGILFILHAGIPWEYLPAEMGCSGMTCWRRLRDWQLAGVWERIHRALLDKLNAAERIDWSRAIVDSSSVRAVGAGKKTGPNPTDRRKPGSKHHLLTDARGVILAVLLTAASRHDVTQLLPLVDAIPPLRGRVGRPRQRPEKLLADRAYDSEPPPQGAARAASSRSSPDAAHLTAAVWARNAA